MRFIFLLTIVLLALGSSGMLRLDGISRSRAASNIERPIDSLLVGFSNFSRDNLQALGRFSLKDWANSRESRTGGARTGSLKPALLRTGLFDADNRVEREERGKSGLWSRIPLPEVKRVGKENRAASSITRQEANQREPRAWSLRNFFSRTYEPEKPELAASSAVREPEHSHYTNEERQKLDQLIDSF